MNEADGKGHTTEEERRRERASEVARRGGEGTEVPAEGEYNAGDAGSASRRLTTKKKDPRGIY